MQTKDQLRPNYLLLPTTGTAAPTAAAARALMWQTPLSLLCLLCAWRASQCLTNVLCTTPTWPTWLAASVANLNMQTSAHCRLLIAHCIEVLHSANCTLLCWSWSASQLGNGQIARGGATQIHAHSIAHLLQTQMKYISFKVNTLPPFLSSKFDFRVNQALSQWKYLYLAFSSIRKDMLLLIYVAQIQYKIL